MSRTLIKKITATERIASERLFREEGMIHTFLNPVSYLTALKHKELFCGFDGIMVDGSILAGAIRMLYGVKVRRRSFDMTSIAASLFGHILSGKKTVYLIGARQEQIERAAAILAEQYPGLRITGYRNGYFPSEEAMREVCGQILRLNPDYVIAGMGTPLQERFLSQLKEDGYRGIGFTCGGFLSQLSLKGIRYYPRWADKYNLRFLYRFYKERHTRERYLKAAFLFPLYFIWNRLK